MPSQGFQFRITPILAGVRQASRQFEFPWYMSGELVSISMDQLEPGASYIFSATAMNTYGTSAATISQMQHAAGTSASSVYIIIIIILLCYNYNNNRELSVM